MKNMNRLFIATILMALLMPSLQSCDNDFENPNSTTSETILNTKDGLIALSVGVRQLYSTTGVRYVIETPAVTTREVASTSTFLSLMELEDGGVIPNDNANTQGLWVTLTRVMGMGESLYAGADNVELEPGTKSGFKAYGNLFRALCVGHLSYNFEQVVLKTSTDNKAPFVPRQQGFLEAIKLLEDAKALIIANPVSSEFNTKVLGGKIDLTNTINLLLAKFNLNAGNYDAAITNAALVSKTSKSEFTYDSLNLNPIWVRGVGLQANSVNFFHPQDNFGLPASFIVNPADGRLAKYLIASTKVNANGFKCEDLKGFFETQTSSIPVYIPDEANLIIAEANLRKTSPNIPAALVALNEVLTDTDDPLGVNANLAPYAGTMDVSSILLEVYKNRRAELFLTGNSLEDSRRFGRPQPNPALGTYTDERNRNFYPYSRVERNNNTNTPADPSI
jgi:hypothetical protein